MLGVDTRPAKHVGARHAVPLRDKDKFLGNEVIPREIQENLTMQI